MVATKIRKILIANRGEIAVRIIRACRDIGITAAAVYSECDRGAYHVALADEAYPVGASPSNQSYLVHDNIIAAARQARADAIHPGYGFLAESPAFAQRCVDEGIVFIGPTPNTITLLGDKLKAREAAMAAGLPIVPGVTIAVDSPQQAFAGAERLGFPVLIKAAAGGGGKGMRIVSDPAHFLETLPRAASEAASAFGDGRVYLEKYLDHARHIEIQILCDQHGNAVHLGERECSIQRRYQKLIEESPSPVMTPELRERMGEAAVDIARQTGYIGAGTVEFMVAPDLSYYFLEVNTRLQVEHPVTELVTGIDLVKEQISIAEGHSLHFRQKDIALSGHAIECRLYAEDPESDFAPSTGKLTNYRIPAGPGVRVDSGVIASNEVPVYYDPMIAKLIVWGRHRGEAIERMRRALDEYHVSGVNTTIAFHRAVMNSARFTSGDLSTSFVGEVFPDGRYSYHTEEMCETAAIAAALHKFAYEHRAEVSSSTGASTAASSWVIQHRRRNLSWFGGSR